MDHLHIGFAGLQLPRLPEQAPWRALAYQQDPPPPWCGSKAAALLLQVGLPWDACATSATLPMALLTSIVRKEALLPEHTVAFAATQLLPVIQAATQRRLACHPCSSTLCRELLVSPL